MMDFLFRRDRSERKIFNEGDITISGMLLDELESLTFNQVIDLHNKRNGRRYRVTLVEDPSALTQEASRE